MFDTGSVKCGKGLFRPSLELDTNWKAALARQIAGLALMKCNRGHEKDVVRVYVTVFRRYSGPFDER